MKNNQSNKSRIIGLITDFGTKDYFVGLMKGVIRQIATQAEIIDITHDIPSFEILPACFVLEQSLLYFPSSSIFIVVVDPGVGTTRRILVVEYDRRFFIGPDNGILTPILCKTKKQVWSLENSNFFLINGSSTFEARDKMSPAAAFLARGIDPSEAGPIVSDYVLIDEFFPVGKENEIKGRIVYIDKFGNIITNIPGEMIDKQNKENGAAGYFITFGGTRITARYETYGDASSHTGPFMLTGSHGNIEIAMNKDSAANKLHAAINREIKVSFR